MADPDNITEAEAACAAKDAKAAESILPTLIAPALACEQQIQKATR